MEERNKKLIHIESAVIGNKGNLDKIPELFHEAFVRHFLPTGTQTRGLAEYRSEMALLRAAFPDWNEEIRLMVAEGDLVAVWLRSTGTNSGEFADHPPSGNRVVTNNMSIYRIAEGKIAEQWLLPDLWSLKSQLGFIPASEIGKVDRERSKRAQTNNIDQSADRVQSCKALALKANVEIWNRGNFETLEEMFASGFVQHFLPFGTHTTGLDEVRRSSIAHREAFPDWAEIVNMIVAEGEYVALEYTSTGTNTGSFLGKLPTGKRIQIGEMTFFRILKGKIVEQWLLPDVLSLNRQLGLLPTDN